MATTPKRKQWEREDLADGSTLVWAQHGRYHTVYTCQPIVTDAPENHYHGTSSFEAEKAFTAEFVANLLDG